MLVCPAPGKHCKIKKINMNKSQLRQLIRESIREIMGGKQMLNEELYCPPGYAGTSCGSGGGNIWCEFPGNDFGLPPGCFCQSPRACANQNSSNATQTISKDDTILNKPSDNSFDLPMGKINEDKLPSCWCCFGGLGGGRNQSACYEQPGRVDGCYKSSSKCDRKCGKNNMVSQNTPTQYS